MKKVIELIHPEGRVVGTTAPSLRLYNVESCKQAAISSNMFWEPIQCSNNPSLSSQGGDAVNKFPISSQAHCKPCFFFSRLFSRDKVSESCFTGQLPGIGTVFILASLQMCKVQRQSPLTNQREAAGVCWVWGELCEEVAEGWGLAIEIVMVGWVLEEEAGCKC